MTGLAEAGRGMPCGACAAARVLPEKPDGHRCTGLAAFSDGTVPCPCCGGPKAQPLRFCRLCQQPIWPGEPYATQLAQSESGAARVTNYWHTPCPPAGGTA